MTLPQPNTAAANTAVPRPTVTPGPDFTVLDGIVAELEKTQEQVRDLMASRDTELRRLRMEDGVAVSALKDRAKLSKSSVRLITTPPRGR